MAYPSHGGSVHGATGMSRTRGVNTSVLIGGFVLVAPLIGLLAMSFGNNPREVPSVLVGTQAPAFELVDLEGKTWNSNDLKGKPVVLNFWSTWCLPCKQEHGLLQQTAQAVPGVTFLGVIYADEPDACRRYLAKKGTTYHHLIDDKGRLAIEYGVAGVPETYFIDANGMIQYKHAGAVTPGLMQQQLKLLGVL